METVSIKDRERLRSLAQLKLSFAHSKRNEEILKQWEALANGVKAEPTVRLLFSNFPDEVIEPRLVCEGKDARELESEMLWSMVGRELFNDDTPISPNYEINLDAEAVPFGATSNVVYAKTAKGFHIEPITDDIEADIDMFRGGSFRASMENTVKYCDWVNDIFGDILPAKITGRCLLGPITNPLVFLIGMENYYLSMYDAPDSLHEIMEMATQLYLDYYDYLEKENLLLPTNDYSFLAQESFCFTNELPKDGPITSTKQVWGFLESQETTACSPEAYGEFVYPYLDRLVKRFGLLSYGCCERVDVLWEDYLSKWTNLRKLSVSPFNDGYKVGEYLRGTNVVYYSKPRAEYVTNRAGLEEDVIRNYFKEVAECASGCLFEVAQREVGTIYGDIERGRRYVELAKQTINTYWKP